MTDTPNRKPRRGAGRVAFLAHLEQFRKLIEAGNEQRTIYDEFGGETQLGISYSQFNRYVVRYITGAKSDGHQKKEGGQPAISRPSPASAGAGARTAEVKKQTVFQHNPSSGNDRDDLI